MEREILINASARVFSNQCNFSLWIPSWVWAPCPKYQDLPQVVACPYIEESPGKIIGRGSLEYLVIQ